MTVEDNKQYVEVIFDLRQYSGRADSNDRIEALWRQISPNLVGKSIKNGNVINLDISSERIGLWVVDNNGLSEVGENTEFRAVDVLRSPKLVYQCAVCGEYGPLRCVKCEEEKRETRLCSKHAHIIKDELSAYCAEHVPSCSCKVGCKETAVFRCRSCARTVKDRPRSLYGTHYHRTHPKEPDVDYCLRCFKRQFERCDSPSCNRLGRSKCHYQTRNGEPCGVPSCSDHSYQWKIWGPHNRGVNLCERHQGTLGRADPEDLIFLILTAKIPYFKRGRRYSMPNPFRLRRLINRHRSSPLSFAQLEKVLKSLEPLVSNWGKSAERNYSYIVKLFSETVGNLDSMERDFLEKVRSYYQNYVSWDASSQILGLQIQDRFSRPGEKTRFRVRLTISGEKGRLIGRGGAHMKQLRDIYNLEVDLD
jgi:hypothetical protein